MLWNGLQGHAQTSKVILCVEFMLTEIECSAILYFVSNRVDLLFNVL